MRPARGAFLATIGAALLAGSAHAQAAPATTRVDATLAALENRSFRAWKDHEASYWPAFLSDRFVGWGAAGRLDKAAATRQVASHDCRIDSIALSQFEVSHLTPAAAVITHKTLLKGACAGRPVAPARWTATVYVREQGRWRAALWAEAPIVNPASLAKPPKAARAETDVPAGADRDTADSDAGILLAREQALWSAWKDHDRRRLDALIPGPIQFINIFGTHLSTRAEALKNWSGEGCKVSRFTLADARARMIAPDVGILTLRASADGTCYGQPVPPVWGSSVYVRRGGAWVWRFGINIPAAAAS